MAPTTGTVTQRAAKGIPPRVHPPPRAKCKPAPKQAGKNLKRHVVTTSNNSDFTVGSASGSLKAEPKEYLTGKGQVLSKGLRAERISRWLTSILLLIKIV